MLPDTLPQPLRRSVGLGRRRLELALRRPAWSRLRLARSPEHFATRQLLGQDSRVCLGAFAKGRSSARRLNHIEAKAGAYELAADLQVGGLWVDSFRMPADAPTREGGVVLPLPARPWVAAFLGGDLTALDTRLATEPVAEVAPA